jgi:tetratricopeptide (TPR) repeat protein
VRSSEERATHLRELAWWIGLEEGDEFCHRIEGSLQANRLSASDVLNIVESNESEFPPYKRLALLRALQKHLEDLPSGSHGRFYYLFARTLGENGLPEDALREALTGLRLVRGHRQSRASFHEVIGTYHLTLGHYRKAERSYKLVYELRKESFVPDHPKIAWSLANLASVYLEQKRFVEAEPLLHRALTIREKVLGSNHPQTAWAVNNLAGSYTAQGRYAEAEPLYERAVVISAAVLGPDHPHTAKSLNNLAMVYHAQGRHAEAERLLLKGLRIQERVLGPDHPDTATTLHNLAGLHLDQSHYAEAKLLFVRALAIWEKVFGPDHPLVVTGRRNLAGVIEIPGKQQ